MTFPLVLSSDTTADVGQLAKDHGAVLVRGVDTVDDFVRIGRLCAAPSRSDIACSAGPRTHVREGVFTANEAPPSEEIPIHHEMAQCERPPSFVLFYCDRPPTHGGCTPFVESSRVAEELRRTYPRVYERIRTEGLRYVREYPPCMDDTSAIGRSWRQAFDATDRSAVEEVLRRRGYSWEWLEGDRLRTVGPISHPLVHNERGEEVLFIAAESVFMDTYEPGRPFKGVVEGDSLTLSDETREALQHIARYASNVSCRIPWTEGDVIVLDNERVMHARDTFRGPRRILVSLLGSIENPSFASGVHHGHQNAHGE